MTLTNDRSVYEDSLKDYRDLKSAIDTYYNDGKKDKAKEIAKNALQQGLSLEMIEKLTGLSTAEIERLK